MILTFAASLVLWKNSIEKFVDTSPVTYREMGSQWGWIEIGWPLAIHRTYGMFLSERLLGIESGQLAIDNFRASPFYWLENKGIIAPNRERTARIHTVCKPRIPTQRY